ncbi:MAG: hypothetical protein VYC39_12635 [Myxococcota bacterium]|nr:hypothetical protein [Myxococcota bacterium]
MRQHRLFFWLGPWSQPWTPEPKDCIQELVTLPGNDDEEDRLSRLRIFVPRRKPIGALFLLPGFHFQGFDHPELYRLVCSLCQTGFIVGAPDIPDFLHLRFHRRSLNDANTLFRAFVDSKHVPFASVGLISISLGSRLAFSICAQNPKEVNNLITFGGYYDWKSALHFCLKGRGDRQHDPLNRPIIFAALQDDLPSVSGKSMVTEAWVTFARRTWGQDTLKNINAVQKIADDWQTNFSPAAKQLFEQGLGISPGGNELIDNVLDSSTTLSWLDSADDLAQLKCPYLAVHACNDDVIEYEQSEELAKKAPKIANAECILTGLYSHSARRLPSLRSISREIQQLRNITRHLVSFD